MKTFLVLLSLFLGACSVRTLSFCEKASETMCNQAGDWIYCRVHFSRENYGYTHGRSKTFIGDRLCCYSVSFPSQDEECYRDDVQSTPKS
jgi:hypothetical protein